MNTVLVIGAGGSLAEAQSFRPKRDGEHPPLDTTFFTKAQQLALRHTRVAQSLDALRSSIARSKTFYDPWVRPLNSLEQFFADVYYEVAGARSDAAFTIFVELLKLYGHVLGATTNWMARRDRGGTLEDLIRTELNRVAEGSLTVITFNQDLVIENCVNRLPQRLGKWCLSSLYGDLDLSPLEYRGTTRFPLFSMHDSTCEHSPPLRLIKLHGSLNWMIRTSASEPKLGTLFPRNPRPSLFLLDTRLSSQGGTLVSDARLGRKRWYLWPVLVPPIYDKQRVTAMDILQELWDAARQAIETADRLTLVGYSVPDADVSAKQMLRRAFTSNTSLHAIDCVNPDPMLGVKLKESLAPRVVRLFHDLGSYLAYG